MLKLSIETGWTLSHIGNMTPYELDLYKAHYHLEPFGSEVQDTRNAINTCVVANSQGNKTKPKEFMVNPDKSKLAKKIKQANLSNKKKQQESAEDIFNELKRGACVPDIKVDPKQLKKKVGK